MSEYIHKSYKVTVLRSTWVFPAKYRRAVFDDRVDEVLKAVCLEIEERYQMKFFGDRDRQRPCPFFGSVGTDIQCDEDCEDVEEHNGTRDIGVAHKSRNNCGVVNSGRMVFSQARLGNMAMKPC